MGAWLERSGSPGRFEGETGASALLKIAGRFVSMWLRRGLGLGLVSREVRAWDVATEYP